MTGGRGHLFGGDWTTRKLAVLAGYLKSYTTALKDKPTSTKPFRKAFIDAFAGTGYREERRPFDEAALPFPDLVEPEPQSLLDGSARLALQTDPPFDQYIFIERNPKRCAGLEALKTEFPGLASQIDVRRGDANAEIQELCAAEKDWHGHRAVLFLDPYGMQVEWSTIEAIAKRSRAYFGTLGTTRSICSVLRSATNAAKRSPCASLSICSRSFADGAGIWH